MNIKARLAASEFDKNKNISVRLSKSFPGSTLHGHDFYELEIVADGQVKTILNGKDYTVERGAVFFLSPADFHEYKYESSFDVYNIQFTSEAVSSHVLERFIDIGANHFTPSNKRFDEICSLFFVMHGIINSAEDDEILTRLLESILLVLMKEANPACALKAPTAPSESIQRAMMYIHSHFKETPALSEVAEAVHLNPNYFCTKFHEYTGKTYKEYLRGIKLRYARRLIIATSLPMIDIAENCGYSTQSHFNREFKEHYGTSPFAMRKNKK